MAFAPSERKSGPPPSKKRRLEEQQNSEEEPQVLLGTRILLSDEGAQHLALLVEQLGGSVVQMPECKVLNHFHGPSDQYNVIYHYNYIGC